MYKPILTIIVFVIYLILQLSYLERRYKTTLSNTNMEFVEKTISENHIITIPHALEYIAQFDYNKYDPENYWKPYQEFITDNGGDCEDFALNACILLTEIGCKNLYLVKTRRADGNHMIIKINNVYFEPQTGGALLFHYFEVIEEYQVN
jgi:hypothetical protein